MIIILFFGSIFFFCLFLVTLRNSLFCAVDLRLRFLFLYLHSVPNFVNPHKSTLTFVFVEQEFDELLCLTILLDIVPKRLYFPFSIFDLLWLRNMNGTASRTLPWWKKSLLWFLTADVSQNMVELIYNSFDNFLVFGKFTDEWFLFSEMSALMLGGLVLNGYFFVADWAL